MQTGEVYTMKNIERERTTVICKQLTVLGVRVRWGVHGWDVEGRSRSRV